MTYILGSLCKDGVLETGENCNTEARGAVDPGDGQFNHPMGLVSDLANNIYVADHLNHRIQKFDKDGNFIGKWGSHGDKDSEFNKPHGLAIDKKDTLYITDSLNHRIQKISLTGKFISKWGSEGSGTGQFYVPRDLVISDSFSVFVSDGSNNRIQIFASEFST